MHVKELWCIPVKSPAGERLDRVHVDPLGLEDDRKVLVRRANESKFYGRRIEMTLEKERCITNGA